MSSNKPIGIFDSGIGGATVLKEILKVLPNEEYIYYSDSFNNPYGDKSDYRLFTICDDIVKFLIEKGCKAIVIACNTASCKEADSLRSKYDSIPIIAIEPAYKMVYDFAKEEPTLILATRGTIESGKFKKLFNKYDNNKTSIVVCSGLADLIENEEMDKVKEYLKNNLKDYVGKVKNVVLGCTHYPLIQDEIKEVLGDVKFFNGAPSLANHLKTVLSSHGLLNDINTEGIIHFIDSCNSPVKKERFYNYLGVNVIKKDSNLSPYENRDYSFYIDRESPNFGDIGYSDGYNDLHEDTKEIVKQLYDKVDRNKLLYYVSLYLQGFESGTEVSENIEDVYDEDGNVKDGWELPDPIDDHEEEALDIINSYVRNKKYIQ
ncbi:MAG: glutamate racemase [Bacilli bacterium]|nr:glutamate racemase [Bacilli bacterium]